MGCANNCMHRKPAKCFKKSRIRDMAGIFSFKCSCCGKQHEGSPSFGFKAPDPWLGQPEEIKQAGKIGDDLCYYTDEDGTN